MTVLFDPHKDPDHYVVVNTDELAATAGADLHAWVICQPGVVQDWNNKPTRKTVKLRGGGFGPLAFEDKEDADNLAAAMNQGRYLQSTYQK
jgi:hypothetical protein